MNYKANCLYINDVEFPLLPSHSEALHDVDLDSYTNTKGYTIRQRIRHNVGDKTLNIPGLYGYQFHQILQMTKDVWFSVTYFDWEEYQFKTRTMYRSGDVSFNNYYLDENPDKSILTDISFSIIEE